VSKKKRPVRTRSLRRSLERSEDKLAHARRRLIALAPGGTPERPIEVSSAAVIEARAESVACPDCAGELRIGEHAAQQHERALLRVVQLSCRRCGAPLTLFFHIVTVAPS
jgi:hypothetical protein